MNVKKLYQKLSKSFAVNLLSSLELSVICLSLLAVLIFWGTLYQADHGLYAAQQKFFNSWFFTSAGFVPFPGARLVLWALFVNLVTNIIFRHAHRWDNLGLLMIHYGILLMLAGGFVTFHFAQESQVTLAEGEGINVSADYRAWEMSIWEGAGHDRQVKAISMDESLVGERLPLTNLPLTLHMEKYYPNSEASMHSHSEFSETINSSGIHRLRGKKPDKEPSKNIPGVTFDVIGMKGEAQALLLYGADLQATHAVIDGHHLFFQLRHTRYPLPFSVQLKDFRMETYPGTETAKSYESTVTINTGSMARDVVISMNKPLRHEAYTFYQASYRIGQDKTEYSTFAVVKNWGRLGPYIATLLAGLGLATHFMTKLIIIMRKRGQWIKEGKKT